MRSAFQITSDPATFLCGFVNQADTSGETCDIIQDSFPRAGAFAGIQGKNARWKDTFDPTLGGLVEVTR